MSDAKKKIKDFIVDTFLYGSDEDLQNDTSMLEEGIIDSTGVLELVSFIEGEFRISVEDDELIPENLDTVDNILKFIEKKTGINSQ